MKKTIVFTLLLYESSFANCILEKNLSREFSCNGESAKVQKCSEDDIACELELETKDSKDKLEINKKGEFHKYLHLNKSNADIKDCSIADNKIKCSIKNRCEDGSLDMRNIMNNGIPSANMSCDSSCQILEKSKVANAKDIYCKSRILGLSLQGTDALFEKYCHVQTKYGEESFDCKLSGILNSLENKKSDFKYSTFLKQCILSKELPNNFDLILKNKLLDALKIIKNGQCDYKIQSGMSLEKLVCIKVQEIVPNTEVNCSEDKTGVRQLIGLSASVGAQKETTQQNTEVKDQPIAEYKRELLTEAPKINHQETLSKIDKLIADNGGNVTPEMAQKAGEIFNAGIYQPTKNFLKTVEQAIGSTSSGTSGSSSSRYKSSKNKSYEIGSKGARNNRVIANVDTTEATAASTTAMNTKISTSTGNVVPSLDKNSVEGASIAKENKQASPGFVSNNSPGPSSMGGHVGGSAVGALSNNGSARNAELQELPALSSSDKTQISLVVKAMKEAESPEDIKSIVTVEENYSQVKRMIQELEQKKRQPASQQKSTEIKEFEKTLNKFGIKVYGESGQGKAVYTPTTVNHVIVLKDNSIRFLNTIRSKR